MKKQEPESNDAWWTREIKSRYGLFELDVFEMYRYRHLLWLFVRRDFVATYKQTVLGPLWHVVHPLLTTMMFVAIFSRVARIPTGPLPPAVFYLSGLCMWHYFSNCMSRTSSTLNANAGIFGKIYFPRLLVPLATVLSCLVSLGIQLLLLLAVALIGYRVSFDVPSFLVITPLVIFFIGALGMGLGLIVASITTKYRDFQVLVGFGLQLTMYATPIIYPLSFVSREAQGWLKLNPLTTFIEGFRRSFLAPTPIQPENILYGTLVSLAVLLVGTLAFNQTEKSFTDVA